MPPRATVLVVEDEEGLVRLIRYNFEKEGYRVVAACDGERALRLFRKQRPDLVILDIMLPRLDGLEVCRLLRKESDLPILFLTAKRSELDRVLGLKLGADDYVTKPFSIRELLARVEAILRRSGRGRRTAGSLFRAGTLQVDFYERRVSEGGRPVGLTAREFELLKLLIEAGGRPVSRDVFLDKIWGEGSEEVRTRTVDQHVARLRRKLGASARRIATVLGVGYRLERERRR